jgi:hypothetical protein
MAADLFPPPRRPVPLIIALTGLVQLGGVNVGSKYFGGGNTFGPVSEATHLYWAH